MLQQATIPDALRTHPETAIPAAIQGLIFDCDGTLIDTMPIHYQAWCQALAPYGLVLGEERFYSYAGMPTRNIVDALNADKGTHYDAEQIAHEKEDIYLKLMPAAPPIPQVIAIARREKDRRKLAVASGGWHRIVVQSLAAAGVLDLFETVVGADDVPRGKPHPDMFLEAARKIAIPPAACLVFEDGEPGFQAARAAGMAVIDVRPWYLPRKK